MTVIQTSRKQQTVIIRTKTELNKAIRILKYNEKKGGVVKIYNEITVDLLYLKLFIRQ